MVRGEIPWLEACPILWMSCLLRLRLGGFRHLKFQRGNWCWGNMMCDICYIYGFGCARNRIGSKSTFNCSGLVILCSMSLSATKAGQALSIVPVMAFKLDPKKLAGLGSGEIGVYYIALYTSKSYPYTILSSNLVKHSPPSFTSKSSFTWQWEKWICLVVSWRVSQLPTALRKPPVVHR